MYDAIYEDNDGRACRDIDDAACREVPGNFFKLSLALALTKLGDALINAKTTLPWLLTVMGAPGWIAAVLVPIRESGSMLPQLVIADVVRQQPLRKRVWLAGALAQALAVFALAWTAYALSGTSGGIAVLLLVIIFSIARGFCSVATKDVLGKTVPKERRGRVSGLAASFAGAGTLVLAAWLLLAEPGPESYLLLLLIGAALWVFASGAFSRIAEFPGATEGGINALHSAIERFSILNSDVDFRRFVVVRSLLVGSALIAPFLVIMTREQTAATLGHFLLAQGAASLLSGNFWGRFADHSSRMVIICTAFTAAALGLGVAACATWLPELAQSSWFLPGAFFLLAIIHDGVRAGRKTYVIDLGDEDTRTDYVAVSNTVLGVVLLLAAGVAAIASQSSPAAAIACFSVAALLGGWLAVKLPEVQALSND